MNTITKNTKIKKYVAVGNASGDFWAHGSFDTLKAAAEWLSYYADSDDAPVYRNVDGDRECDYGNAWIGKANSAKWHYHDIDGRDFEAEIRTADKLRKTKAWHEDN